MLTQDNLDHLIELRGTVIKQLQSMSDAMDLMTAENDSEELDRLMINEKENMQLLGVTTHKINSLLSHPEKTKPKQLDQLKEQEKEWEHFLEDKKKMIQKVEKQIKILSKESRQLDTMSKVELAYDKPHNLNKPKTAK